MNIQINRKSYPSDLTDKKWNLIKHLIPEVKSNNEKGGRPSVYSRREIVNAILYVLSSGCRWVDLPHDLPGKSIAWKKFDEWSSTGIWEKINDFLVIKDRLSVKKTKPQVQVSLIVKP
jgi:transposase